ncbi:MAG: family 20 glycosylhydrolase, partial [Acidobacteriota bacterium]|nr:family 20 glycosylhydrolase [Acidobacteriota bacterium]
MILRRILSISIAMAAAGIQANAQTADLMPMPAEVVPRAGKLAIDGNFRVALHGIRDVSALAGARRLITRLARQTGLPLAPDVVAEGANATLAIRCEQPRKPVQAWNEDESYHLEVTSSGASIQAITPLGALHGMETFLQLVAARQGKFSAAAVAIPAVAIDDKPRFAWRGLHLDVSRHWMPIEVVRRTLDGMAAVKLNVFH